MLSTNFNELQARVSVLVMFFCLKCEFKMYLLINTYSL